MAANYLITGYWGEPHVTAENDRGIHAGIVGEGRYVLPVGERFRAEYIGNNIIRLYDGKLIDNGAAAGIPAGSYVDLSISNAAQGMKRNDLIVFQYTQDTSSMIETGAFVVVQGAATSGTPHDPTLTQNDLQHDDAVLDQMPLWRVTVNGGTISAPVQVFELVKSLKSAVTADNADEAAAARAALGVTPSNIGAVPVTDATASTFDMNALIKSGVHFGFYKTGANTLNTPYKKNVTGFASAMIMSSGSSANNAVQVAFISGTDKVCIRCNAGGTISDWRFIGDDTTSAADARKNLGIQSGVTAEIVAEGSKVTTVDVTFPTAYAAAPIVQVSAVDTSDAQSVGSILMAAADVTKTGFKLKLHNANSSDRTLKASWIAIG